MRTRMMKALYKVLVLLGFVAIAMSCNDELNYTPSTQIPDNIALKTYRDLEAATVGAYNALSNNNVLGANIRNYGDILADHVVALNATNLQIYNRQTQNQAGNPWGRSYNVINAANNIIDAIDRGVVTDATTYSSNISRIRGEALFLRAVAHFEVVRLWAQPYGYTSDNSHPGVILKTKPTTDLLQKQARNTVGEIYTAVIDDLTEASALLPSNYDATQHPVSYNGRATAFTALAYLAKVQFQKGTSEGYTAALTAINQVLGSTPGVIQNFPLNATVDAAYKLSGTTGLGSSPETIFQIINVTGNSSFGNYSSYYRYVPPSATATAFAASATFLKEANYSPADERWRLLFKKATVNNTVLTFSAKADGIDVNLPIIRSAELILDRAEINAINNNLNAALADYNLIKKRAIPTYTQITTPFPELLDSIHIERIRELPFESDRIHDLRRRRADIGNGDRPGALPIPWNHNSLLLKIANDEINNNPLVEQNPD